MANQIYRGDEKAQGQVYSEESWTSPNATKQRYVSPVGPASGRLSLAIDELEHTVGSLGQEIDRLFDATEHVRFIMPEPGDTRATGLAEPGREASDTTERLHALGRRLLSMTRSIERLREQLDL